MNVDRDPRKEYSKRLEDRRKTVAHFERQYGRVSLFRLLTALVFITFAYLTLWRQTLSTWWLLLPVAVFILLVALHERVSRALKTATRAVVFYEDGLARIEDRWIGRGQSTEIFRDDSHLYAPDLDIFGKASLFELLCTARMRAGEETLASWLSGPTSPTQIRERQQAVDELRERVDLREDLAVLATDARSSIHPGILTKWGTSPRILAGSSPRIVMLVFAAVTIYVILFANSYWPYVIAAEAALGLVYRRRVREIVNAVERPQAELSLLSQILSRIEAEEFRSTKLVALRRSLDTDGLPPSAQIHRFNRLMQALDWRRNQLFAPVALVLFWATQLAFAIETWRARCGGSIGPWLQTVGEFEALCALAGFAYEHPLDPFPEITESGPVFEAEDLRHPLVPVSKHVPNTVRLGGTLQLLVVSGSNMSGKSTLLRTVGINAVLALAGAPVRAASLRISPLAIGATLRIQDSLQAGTSRFYAEIQRIHHIMELTKGSLPVLFLLDEVLHGTNSHDRAVGAEAIVRGLVDRAAIGLVTTHDLALATVAEALAPRAANVHFEDTMMGGTMVFDYRMRPGVVHKSNALALMRAVGLEV
jgi:MutS domain V